MDELIWTFDTLINCDDGDSETFYDKNTNTYDHEGSKKHNDRIENGLRLFGRYYRGLWD